MSPVVVDSSVILAVLKQEPGAESANHLDQALASTVNLTEVITKLLQLGYNDDQTRGVIAELSLQSVAFTDEFINLTAQLIKQTKPYGLSLGDRACLALGITKNLPVLTADRAWTKIDLPVEVMVIR
ncbi:MAG: type II toxin-antitoxin system VapC family toxin [Cyanobacteria bacterium J06659_2]